MGRFFSSPIRRWRQLGATEFVFLASAIFSLLYFVLELDFAFRLPPFKSDGPALAELPEPVANSTSLIQVPSSTLESSFQLENLNPVHSELSDIASRSPVEGNLPDNALELKLGNQQSKINNLEVDKPSFGMHVERISTRESKQQQQQEQQQQEQQQQEQQQQEQQVEEVEREEKIRVAAAEVNEAEAGVEGEGAAVDSHPQEPVPLHPQQQKQQQQQQQQQQARELQFLSIGDQGTGSPSQLKVAEAIGKTLRQQDYQDASFMLGLGDNFYMAGVHSVTDPQWQYKFEQRYPAALGPDRRFFPTIGDHDHCLNASALVQYSKKSKHWTLPSFYHTMEYPLSGDGSDQFEGGVVRIVVTDSVGLEGAFTQAIGDRRFHREINPEITGPEAGREQLRWLERELKRPFASPSAPNWLIVVGHRPVLSGSMRFQRDALEFPAENRMRAALKELLAKHKVDVYLNGHDHTTQWLCAGGVSYVVNGVGGYDLHALAKPPPPETVYQNNTHFGFAFHSISPQFMSVTFMDDSGLPVKTLNIPHHGQCLRHLFR